MLIVDGVVHAFNLDSSNFTDPKMSMSLASALFNAHLKYSKGYTRPAEEYYTDWSVDDTLRLVFSEVDIAVFHSLAMYDLFKDGAISAAKGADATARYGPRVIWYAGLDPFDPERSRREIREFAEQGAQGFKFLPSRWSGNDYPNFDFTERNTFYGLLEEMQRVGITNVAVHKASPVGATSQPTNVTDLYAPARDFPEMNFQIVHGGMAFTEETGAILAQFQNVHVTLETTWNLLVAAPRRFAETFSTLLRYGGASKIIYADGSAFVHPRPGLEAFRAYQTPPDLQEGWGVPALTDADRELILGGNLCRLHGIVEQEFRTLTANDAVSRDRAAAATRPVTP